MPDQRVQTTIRLDAELLKRLQHALVERETKMNPVMEKLIRDWLHGYSYKGERAIPSEPRAKPDAADRPAPEPTTIASKAPGETSQTPQLQAVSAGSSPGGTNFTS